MSDVLKIKNEIMFYQMHGIDLGLLAARALAEDQGMPEARLDHGEITLAINCDTQQDVDQSFAKALTAGATLLELPKPVFGAVNQASMPIPTTMIGKLPITRFSY